MEKYKCKTNIISMNYTSDVISEVEDGMLCNFYNGRYYDIDCVLGDNEIFVIRDEYSRVQFFYKDENFTKLCDYFYI